MEASKTTPQAPASQPVGEALTFTERDLMDVEEAIDRLSKQHAERGYSGWYVTLDDDDRLLMCKAWPKLQAHLRAALSHPQHPAPQEKDHDD